MTEETGFPEPDSDVAVMRPKRPRKAEYRVRRNDPTRDDYPVVAKFEGDATGLNQARNYVKTNHPRGREVFIEHPDGMREHYSADHAHQGLSDGWISFDEDEED